MVAHWMRVGFVHGVMNTDNMSVLGLTIDYGPYGWLEGYDPTWTPNTTDAGGRRYRFGAQPQIAQWNLGRLAAALAPVFGSVEPLQRGMNRYVDEFARTTRADVAAKLGLAECRDEDVELMHALQAIMRSAEIDMTIFFRRLIAVEANAAPAADAFDEAFYDDEKRRRSQPALDAWLERYRTRLRGDPLPPEARRDRMRAANPRYVLRNYLAQQAIDRAERGDYAGVTDLLEVLRRPYDDQPGAERFAARRPDWARDRPGCSMLSCSS
jgi:uncharacterized protein YdiU (UPF0061 family)